jgi:hypothetical protein
MIHSTSSSDRTARTEAVASSVAKTAVSRPGSDRFSAQHTATLQAALAAQPEIRLEVVARGRQLAADPSYPSAEILNKVGEAILKSPDLSADES